MPNLNIMKIARLKTFYYSKYFSFFIIIFLILGIISCKNLPTNSVFSTFITIKPNPAFGNIGQMITFTVQVTQPETNESIRIIWHSQNDTIASIDSGGVCELKEPGRILISAAAELSDGRVVAQDTALLYSENMYIEIYPRELHLHPNDTYQLYQLNDYPGTKTIWISSNTSIVTVDSLGFVKALDLGSAFNAAIVKYTSSNISCRDSIKVYVE